MMTLYTIGHGRHPFEYFLELLKKYEINSSAMCGALRGRDGRSLMGWCWRNC